jgi:hypothetical protein
MAESAANQAQPAELISTVGQSEQIKIGCGGHEATYTEHSCD